MQLEVCGTALQLELTHSKQQFSASSTVIICRIKVLFKALRVIGPMEFPGACYKFTFVA